MKLQLKLLAMLNRSCQGVWPLQCYCRRAGRLLTLKIFCVRVAGVQRLNDVTSCVHKLAQMSLPVSC